MGGGGPGGYRHNPNRDRNNMVSFIRNFQINFIQIFEKKCIEKLVIATKMPNPKRLYVHGKLLMEIQF